MYCIVLCSVRLPPTTLSQRVVSSLPWTTGDHRVSQWRSYDDCNYGHRCYGEECMYSGRSRGVKWFHGTYPLFDRAQLASTVT